MLVSGLLWQRPELQRLEAKGPGPAASGLLPSRPPRTRLDAKGPGKVGTMHYITPQTVLGGDPRRRIAFLRIPDSGIIFGKIPSFRLGLSLGLHTTGG